MSLVATRVFARSPFGAGHSFAKSEASFGAPSGTPLSPPPPHAPKRTAESSERTTSEREACALTNQGDTRIPKLQTQSGCLRRHLPAPFAVVAAVPVPTLEGGPAARRAPAAARTAAGRGRPPRSRSTERSAIERPRSRCDSSSWSIAIVTRSSRCVCAARSSGAPSSRSCESSLSTSDARPLTRASHSSRAVCCTDETVERSDESASPYVMPSPTPRRHSHPRRIRPEARARPLRLAARRLPRPDVRHDAHDRVLAVEEHGVDREAHEKRVDGARAPEEEPFAPPAARAGRAARACAGAAASPRDSARRRRGRHSRFRLTTSAGNL